MTEPDFKEFHEEVRWVLGKYSDYISDDEIIAAWECNYDARDYANQCLLELADQLS